MKNKLKLIKLSALLLACSVGITQAQTQVANLRPYDKTGLHVFESPKDTAATFEKIHVAFGAGFTQGFQGLKHENKSGGLHKITPGFNTANANLFMDVQLADGIRLNLTSYLSSRHHNETWVKGGYIQFDKMPFKGQVWENIMKVATLKIGHMEINYGDQHFRRSDGGHTLYNPFVENYIMDAFTTEIGGEVLLRKYDFFGSIGVSNGMIKGNIDSLIKTSQDDNIHKSPSLYLKGGFDKTLSEALRVRLSGSLYTNKSSGGLTLYGGDRTGSNYFMVAERAGGTYAANAFSGRFNPGFSKRITAMQFNGFVKAMGLEIFGTYEAAKGRTKSEASDRKSTQYAIESIYRFGRNKKLFAGMRYNSVQAKLADIASTSTTAGIKYDTDIKINRLSFGAGWFLTDNILLKAEYARQKYNDFPTADYRNEAKFNGYVVQAVVGF